MKYTKYMMTLIFLCVFSNTYAQKVTHNGKEYEVDKKEIYLDGVNVTNTLSAEEKKVIITTLKSDQKKLKEEKKAIKQKRKEEKKYKKAKKKVKKLEKELKRKQKRQKKALKTKKKYEKALKKYEKLKGKDKLSAADEIEWQKKLEKLQRKMEKAERKL